MVSVRQPKEVFDLPALRIFFVCGQTKLITIWTRGGFMSVVIVGGNDRMVRQYKDLC